MDVVLLGEIQDLTNEINENINAVKEITNAINTKTANTTDVSAIKTNTNTNNTESSSGTLSQKLSYLINRRDRIITPSSTNIKTLSTSLSASSADSEGASTNDYRYFYSSSSPTIYIKYSGIYRFYFSGTLQQDSYNSSKQDECGLVGFVYVYHVATGTQTTHEVQIHPVTTSGKKESTKVSLSSVTKTIDVPIQTSDRVCCKIALKNKPYNSGACVADNKYYFSLDWSANCTEVSIRGTAQEVNSITT